MSTSHSLPTLLLIEDNEDDVFIFERAYRHAGLKNPVQIVRDGAEAMEYLGGKGKFADRARYPLPFLTLLDLKLPLHSGLDVLEWMRGQPTLADLTVIVLTSSAELRDIVRAQRLQARAYLVKPPTVQTLEQAAAACSEANAGNPAFKIPGDRFGDLGSACGWISMALRAWRAAGVPADAIPSGIPGRLLSVTRAC